MISILDYIAKFRKSIIFSISILFTILIGYIDLETGVELSVSLFYLIPIALSSWFVGKWSGLFFSLLSSVIWFVADDILNNTYSHPFIPYWNALVLLGFFVTVSLILSILKNSVETENRLAVIVQKGLLPGRAPEFTGYEIAITWKPKSFVSGDFYDFVNLNESKLGICIGDAMGHGVAAALLTSNLQSAVRLISHQFISSAEICRNLNNSILENEITGKFITFFYCILDKDNSTLEYTNAGHPPALIFEENKSFKKLEEGGTMIGVAKDQNYNNEIITLLGGDKVVLYTDGIVEAKNFSGELFGEERLIETCIKNFSLSAEDLSKKIMQSVTEFSNGLLDDDISMLIISKNGGK